MWTGKMVRSIVHATNDVVAVTQNSDKEPLPLGPFYLRVEGQLARKNLRDLKQMLLQAARELEPWERRRFLDMLSGTGPSVDWTAIDTSVHMAAYGDLIEDIDAFVDDLRTGKYFEHNAFDPALGRDRAFGDGSWVDLMNQLFARTHVEYLAGDYELAVSAYGRLLEAFLLDDGATFCGPGRPEELVEIDVNECKARYFRSIYETANAMQRSLRLLEAVRKLAPIGSPRVGVRDMDDADITVMKDVDSFLHGWLDALQASDPTQGGELGDPSWSAANLYLMKEAVERARGSAGLEKLAKAKGSRHPEFYHSWVAALSRENKYREALAAAKAAIPKVDDLQEKARLADSMAELATWCDERDEAIASREKAWRWEPTPLRLIQYLVEGFPASSELDRRVQTQLRAHLREDYELDGQLASMLELLAGNYNVAAHRLDHASPLGWSEPGHPGPILLPFLLHAGCGQREPIPGTSIAALWDGMDAVIQGQLQAEMRRESLPGVGTQLAPNIKFSTLLQSALRARPVDPTMQAMFIAVARTAAVARARAIVSRSHRKAYARAAVVIVGCVEALLLGSSADSARSFLGEFRREYPRHRTFQFELDALIESSLVARRIRR